MSVMVRGTGVSPGIAVGPIHVVREPQIDSGAARSPQEETAALDAAVNAGVAQLEELAARLRAQGHESESGIMDAQSLMLQDPSFLDNARQAIASGASAVRAVRESGEHFAAMFEGLDDPYLAARAADVLDVAERLSRLLLGTDDTPLTRPSIVVARDLTPSQTAALDRTLVLGFATDRGSETSHTAILARALGIPAVVGTGNLTAQVREAQELALDGTDGTVVIEPDAATRELYAERSRTLEHERARLRTLRDEPAETRDGHRITLAANIGSPDDLPQAIDAGAEGVGLFRTEFLFAGRDAVPSEDEQYDAYRTVLERMAPHAVVVRTLDIGGDKPLPYLPQSDELNPFLGERGIRYTRAHPNLLRSQLRALLRASGAGRLAIMFPMVGELDQIREAMATMREVQAEVGGAAEVGIMIEIPAAATLAEQLARHVAFFSVGTNDLVQYGLAVDRTNDRVSSLYHPLHPGILRLLQMTADGAHAHGRWAGVCGEMAGDPVAIPLLLGLGFDELSMTPNRIPAARARIRGLTLMACRDLAQRALTCETALAVEALVRETVGG